MNTNVNNLVKGLLALSVDACEELTSADAQQVVTELQAALANYTPGNKPTVDQIVNDAAAVAEDIGALANADGSHPEVQQVIDKGAQFAMLIAAGKTPLGAVITMVFKKAPAVNTTATS